MYAAAHPAAGGSLWLSLQRLDTDRAQLSLDGLAKGYAPGGEQIILRWDGAPSRRARGSGVPDRITIVGLPPYTPELNPAENLWPVVKEGVANDSFKDLGALEKRVRRRVGTISEDRQLISSRPSYHWWPNA
ncbi:MAG: transposase [Blastocatellia bacterium]